MPIVHPRTMRGPEFVIRLRPLPRSRILFQIPEAVPRYPPVLLAEETVGFLTGGATGANKDFASITVAVGDVLTVTTITEDNSFAETVTNQAGTATTSAWTRVTGTNGGTQTRTAQWAATVTGAGTVTVRVTITGGVPANSWWGATRRHWENSEGVGASISTIAAQNSLLTEQQDESAILIAVGDWGANDPAGQAWNPGTATTTSVGRDTGGLHYTWYSGILADADAASTTNYGVSTPIVGTPSVSIMEVLGSTTEPGGGASETDLTPATATFSAVAVDPVAGGVVTLTPAVATLSAVAVTATPGQVAVALTVASLTCQSIAVTPVPQPVAVSLTPAVASLTAVSVVATPAVNLGTATAAFTAVALNPVPGSVSTTLTPATVTVSAVTVAAIPQPVNIAATPAVAAFTAVALNPVPGSVAVALTPAIATLTAVPVSVGGVGAVAATPAVATFSAVAVQPVPQPVSVNLGTATANFSALALNPVTQAVQVALTPATAALVANTLNPVGTPAVTLTPAVIALSAVTLEFVSQGDPAVITGTSAYAGALSGVDVSASTLSNGSRHVGSLAGRDSGAGGVTYGL